MKQIIGYIKGFILEDYGNIRYFLSVLLLVILFVSYYTGGIQSLTTIYRLEANIFYLLFLCFIFLAFYLISNTRLNIKQLLFIIFSVATLYFNYETRNLSEELFNSLQLNPKLYNWFYKCFVNFQKVAALGIPLFIVYSLQRKELNNFYGFSSKGFNARPYLIMLLFMLPLIIGASMFPSFQNKYPRYKPGLAEELGLISEFVSVGFFELTYFLRFVGVEAFFRGFLIIGGVLVFGRKAILPAACIYSAWHFGKPMGEAIGAFFGGYVLGILAYRTQSIFGGIAIHYGIALLMELAAWGTIIIRL